MALVAWLAARRVAGSRRGCDGGARGVPRTVAEIPLGGLTVILDLHPLAVMSRFLLALVVVALSVVVALEAWSHAAASARRLHRVGSLVALSDRVRAPHGRHRRDRDRLRSAPRRRRGRRQARARDRGHRVRPRSRDRGFRSRLPARRVAAPPVAARGPRACCGWPVSSSPCCSRRCSSARSSTGNALPWGLVLVHVTLGAGIWGLTVATAHALWRPPVPLPRDPASERVERVGEALRLR